MIISGKDALDLELSSADGSEESIFFDVSKIPTKGTVSVAFLREPGDFVAWLQHQWWANDKFHGNPNGDVVTRNVIFPSLIESWTDPIEKCPGMLMGSKGKLRYSCPVLLDDGENPAREKLLTFTKSVWDKINATLADIRADWGDDAGITDKWLRISNSGEGADRYSVSYTGKPFKEHGKYKVTIDPIEYIKIYSFPEIVQMMREAGLPIDEKLAEHNLNELGLTVEKGDASD